MDYIEKLVEIAIAEDIGKGDITSAAVIPKGTKGRAEIIAEEEMRVAGIYVAAYVFKRIDKKIKIKIKIKDGRPVKRGTVLAEAVGDVKSLLSAERTALNFLQRLCGIATLTNKFVSKIRGTGVKILDTRKTTPGWRILEKYAVRTGGGANHRFGLFDMYLIKNNHIATAGSVTEAVMCAMAHRKKGMLIETEARNLEELKQAAAAGSDIIMLDNFSPPAVKKAVSAIKELGGIIKKRPLLEVSGGVNLANVRRFARMDIDFISVGAITHSAPAANIHMLIDVF